MSDARVVVTGMSGAGKSTALKALADIGYYCVDNLPPMLAGHTVTVLHENGIERIALGMDVRVGAFHESLREAIEELRPKGLAVLYLDASNESLVRRFSETRRPHPMLAREASESEPRGVIDGVRLERERLGPLRDRADVVLDSTHLSVHELRRQVIERFGGDETVDRAATVVRVVSFGFKHGTPLDADLMFDVRFLKNPYFVPELREQVGTDAPVRDYVLASDGAEELLAKLEDFLAFTLPRYEEEGKSYLTVAIGCTGGRHRSVALAEELARRLSQRENRRIGIVHRDARRGAMMKRISAGQDELGGRRRRWSEPARAQQVSSGAAEPGDGQRDDGHDGGGQP